MGPFRCWALLGLLPALVWAKTWTVDDDRSQCRNADFTRIQDAVDAASPGDRIHVCPGLYVESVTVAKPLVLEGSGPAPMQRTGDPQREAVVRPPAGSDGFILATADTEVTFFTVWSQQAGVLEDVGIRTGPDSSDDAIERNAIWEFHHGVELRSNNLQGDTVVENVILGPPPGTTFNGEFGIHLIAIRVDTSVARNVIQHYRIAIAADPGAMSVTPVSHLEIDHNEISDVWDAVSVVLAEDSEIARNRATVDRSGIEVLESARISIVGNSLVETDVHDFGFGPGINVFQTSDFSVFDNEVSRFVTPSEFNSAALRLFLATNGKVEHNLVHDNQVGHGIALDSSSSANVVKENMTYRNTRDGLLVEAGSSGNTMLENFSFQNGQFDAEDGNRTNNLWCRTFCQTDNPPGTICGQTDPGCH